MLLWDLEGLLLPRFSYKAVRKNHCFLHPLRHAWNQRAVLFLISCGLLNWFCSTLSFRNEPFVPQNSWQKDTENYPHLIWTRNVVWEGLLCFTLRGNEDIQSGCFLGPQAPQMWTQCQLSYQAFKLGRNQWSHSAVHLAHLDQQQKQIWLVGISEPYVLPLFHVGSVTQHIYWATTVLYQSLCCEIGLFIKSSYSHYELEMNLQRDLWKETVGKFRTSVLLHGHIWGRYNKERSQR